MERGSGGDLCGRGRWRMMVLVLVPVACAAAGSYLLAFGYGPPWHIYRSEAVVRWIGPFMPWPSISTSDDAPRRHELQRFQQLLTSDRVLSLAREDDGWQSLGHHPDEARLELVGEGPDVIRVRSRSADPAAAAAGVMTAVHSLGEAFEEDQRSGERKEIARLEGLIASLRARLDAANREERSERNVRLVAALERSLENQRDHLRTIRSGLTRARIEQLDTVTTAEQPSDQATALGKKLFGVAGFWLVSILVLGALEARHRAAFRSRCRRGVCTSCGYDLRASPAICPECGTPRPVGLA